MYFFINLIKRNWVVFIFLLIGAMLTIALMAGGAFVKELVVQKTSLPAGQIETIYQTDPIIFYFSEPIDEKTIQISVVPETKFNFREDTTQEGGTISISPIPWWKYDTNYTITFDKNLTGKQGSKLKADFVFSFSLTFPKTEENMPQQPGSPPGYPNL